MTTYDLHTVSRRLMCSLSGRYDQAWRDWDTNKTFTEEEMAKINAIQSLLNRLDGACKIETYGDAHWQHNMLLSLDHTVQSVRSMWCGECWTKHNDCVHGAQWWLAEAREGMDRAYWNHKYATEELERARQCVIEAEKELQKHVR